MPPLLRLLPLLWCGPLLIGAGSACAASLPTAAEAREVCAFVAGQFRGIDPITVQAGVIDVNNDGSDERIGAACFMGRPICPREARTLDGAPVAYDQVGFEWKDFWTYGFGWLRYAGRTYGVHTKDDEGSFISHLTYLAEDDHEHLVCMFENDVREFMSSIDQRNISLCAEVGAKRILYLDEMPIGDMPSSRIGRPETHPQATVRLDADNDGRIEALVRLEYSSGAGRGCDSVYFDVLSEQDKGLDIGPTHRRLMELQQIEPDAKVPGRCGGNQPRWFEYRGTNYLEVKYPGTQPTGPSTEVWWVGRVWDGKIERVCQAHFSVTWRVCGFGPAFNPVSTDGRVPTECPNTTDSASPG